MNTVPVTLYIPCYQADSTLPQVLQAVSQLHTQPEKILIIDDGSPNPLQIANKNIEIIRQPQNLGLAAARNCAITACLTPFLAAIDADVVPDPNWLGTLLSILKQKPDIVGVGGRLDEFYHESLPDRWRSIHMAQHWGDAPCLNPRFLYGANSLFRTEVLQTHRYNPALKTNYEDMALSEHLYSQGFNLFYEPAARCLHLRQDSLTSILTGFWKWYHAKGLLRGDFDGETGLIRRIADVNFGIFTYRFSLDLTAGRQNFLLIDLLLPWIFCALDLQFASKRMHANIPALPMPFLEKYLIPDLLNIFQTIIPIHLANPSPPLWFDSYLNELEISLQATNWVQLAKNYKKN